MRKIVYTQLNGVLAIVHPVASEGLSDAEAEERAWAMLPKDAITPVFVDACDIPSDRTLRDTWAFKDGKVVAASEMN